MALTTGGRNQGGNSTTVIFFVETFEDFLQGIVYNIIRVQVCILPEDVMHCMLTVGMLVVLGVTRRVPV